MADFFDQEDPRAFIRAVPDPAALADEFTTDVVDADPYRVPEVEHLLTQAIDDITEAKTAPMSTLAKINRDEILDLLGRGRLADRGRDPRSARSGTREPARRVAPGPLAPEGEGGVPGPIGTGA